ncbi:midasin [Nematocida homosporus]|uniref:midasin n=1 Tax=Nematocida homosporus TaxID=1912981 RepID=UPI00221F1A23|nr:midasin [Nematocida homosporus]KAI5184811.1 midasin [Nematocida homosporus]
MNPRTTDTFPCVPSRANALFSLFTQEQLLRFSVEYDMISQLSLPIQIPFLIQAKELVYALAEQRNIPVLEIEAAEVQDVSALVEQIHLEETTIIAREGVLTRAMSTGSWLIVNSAERENSVTDYIIAEMAVIPAGPRRGERPAPTFQVFVHAKDYTGTETEHRGGAYPIRFPAPEDPVEFLTRLQTTLPSSNAAMLLDTALVALGKFKLSKNGVGGISGSELATSSEVYKIDKIDKNEVVKLIRREEGVCRLFNLLVSALLKALERPGTADESRVSMFVRARDILLAGHKATIRADLEEELAQMLCLPAVAIAEYEKAETARMLQPLQAEKEYVLTQSAERLLLGLLRGLDIAYSFLLIGETGTGKTTTVQKLFQKRSDLISSTYKDARKLLCINLSKDTDTTDLLGSYQFATLEGLAITLNDTVQGYFADFFVPTKNEQFLTQLDELVRQGQIETLQETVQDLLLKFQERHLASPQNTRQALSIAKLQKTLALMQRLQAGAQNICTFMEGPLTRAFLYGYWILLDESNLAPRATLAYINSALKQSALFLLEDSGTSLPKDPRTLVFQCINPGDDHGKKDIVMDQTITLAVDEIDTNPPDILKVALSYRQNVPVTTVEQMTQFYIEIKKCAQENYLRMGSGRPALFGIRNLIRAVQMAHTSPRKALQTNFLTQLCLLHKEIGRKLLTQFFPITTTPSSISTTSSTHPSSTNHYIITPTTQTYLDEITAAIEAKVPVLLEGSTSVGKTSLIKHLAQLRDKQIIRINNHEHTELAEYLGAYSVAETSSDSPDDSKRQKTTSQFIYREGALVDAVRNGHWVLLDELNLAPTEVLESLNRLLDSNRELFIPATQEVIQAHAEFALFATQNPAESLDYKNRKHLSKAFRNRFIEIYVEDKTRPEMEAILLGKKIGKVSAKTLLEIYESLKSLSGNRAHQYITLREIMRIIRRYQAAQPSFIDKKATDPQKLFYHTMMVLTEKIRERPEKEKVITTIITAFEKMFREKFTLEDYRDALSVPLSPTDNDPLLVPGVVRTLRQMEAAWLAQESILLVGPPGIGKTYLSEYTASRLGIPCTVMGMHAGIELSDFVGSYSEHTPPGTSERHFLWRNGPLIEAMENGAALVIDEINLVPDSVLESLNELFDDRSLRIHERSRSCQAHESFRIIGTMNPGDDYGKREVGKSISSRFTTICVDPPGDLEESLKYFMYYVEKYGLLAKYTEAEMYMAAHKALAQTQAEIESAREAEVLARYLLNRPDSSNTTTATPTTASPTTTIPTTTSSQPNTSQYLVQLIREAIELVKGRAPQEEIDLVDNESVFGAGPFILQKSALQDTQASSAYTFEPRSVRQTLFRVLQALFCRFNVLLEGPPGTGKTKMILELGARLGQQVTRINLSKETEMADLAGRCIPTATGIRFVEGEFVRAAKRGDWIIIDEINLATQSVIEGLNGCLDYRRALYIPELGEVQLHPSTVIFATMNPKSGRADGRKLLPKSFLSRFIRIFRGDMSEADLVTILRRAPTPNPNNREALLSQIIHLKQKYPLNLRDCLKHMAIGSTHLIPSLYAVTETQLVPTYLPEYQATATALQVGQAILPGNLANDPEYVITHGNLTALEIVIWGVEKNWPVILRGGVGKGRLTLFIARHTSRHLFVLPCHKDMEPSDFLGRYTQAPPGSGTDFIWEDAPFVKAAEAGSLIFLKNVNLVRNDVIDRLNSLFEQDGTLEIHEKGGEEVRVVQVHPKTRFFLGVSAAGKELSHALINRSIQARISSSLSPVDICKIVQFPIPANKGPVLRTRGVYRVSAAVLRAHVQARQLLHYNALQNDHLVPLISNLPALKEESPLVNCHTEASIQAHLISLAETPLKQEIATILFSNPQPQAQLTQLIERVAEAGIEKSYRAFYRNRPLFYALKEAYVLCAAYREQPTTTPPPKKPGLEGALANLIYLQTTISQGENGLRAYFEAMDLPFIPRKKVSLRLAKLSLLETTLNPDTELAKLQHTPIITQIAQVLDSLPIELEKTIAKLETRPPAYEALLSLISECLKHQIDPLIFPEIEEIERAALAQINKCVYEIRQAYAQYKYGDKYSQQIKKDKILTELSLPSPAKSTSNSTSLAELRQKRQDRNFPKFAEYLKGVIHEVQNAPHPEAFAFSIVQRNMAKYADLWDCFAYTVLRDGIERIAQREEHREVHPIGAWALDALTARHSPLHFLRKTTQYLQKQGLSYLSLTPVQAQAVAHFWTVQSGGIRTPEEISQLAASILLECPLSAKYPALAPEGRAYLLSRDIDTLFTTATSLKPKGLCLTYETANELPAVFTPLPIITLITDTQKEIKNKLAKDCQDSTNIWKEEDGAGQYVLERMQEVLSLPCSLPLQVVAKDLDKLNHECIHIGLLSTPLNTARMQIYKEFASLSAYDMPKYTQVHPGWLLHLFQATQHPSQIKTFILAIEEFLLQSTLGDMQERVSHVAHAVTQGAPYQINNIQVYFQPYLEITHKKKERISEAINKDLADIQTALAVKIKTKDAIIPIREESILSKSVKVQTSLDSLSTPILTLIKPHTFINTLDLSCKCAADTCYLCLAQTVQQRKAQLEKESTSIKLRQLYLLFERLSSLMPRTTSRNTIPGAAEFYHHQFTGTPAAHQLLAKIIHLGDSILRTEPNITHQIAVRLSEFTVRVLNHALNTAPPEEYPFLLVSLGLFYELLTFGFCGEDEDEGVLDGLIEELEDAGMRLGEGEKNISENLKTEEEVGDNYQGEKDEQETEINEEDGVDCQNEGEVQTTAGAEETPDIELEQGSVSENEENYNQRNKEAPAEDDSEKDKGTPEEESDENGSDGSTQGSEEDPNPSEGEEEDPQKVDIDPELPDQRDDMHIQEMEVCSDEPSDFSHDALEEAEDCDLNEESLDRLELLSEESSSEEISIEQYDSEENQTNLHHYSFEEAETNTEQLFEDAENMPSDDQVGHEEGQGAEREVAAEGGETLNDQAIDTDELYDNPSTPTEPKEVLRKAAFKKPVRDVDPATYYESIKHQTNPELTKQLGIVLEENEKTSYEGDYASGRRLNMKRIVSYVASNGQKNRIWMRKTKTQGREYLIRIFVDNSGSIKNNGMAIPLISSLTTIANSLDLLSVSYELYTFSTTVQAHHNIKGLVDNLTFAAQETRISWAFEEQYATGHNIIIGDGLFYDSMQAPGLLPNTLLLVVGSGNKIKEMRSVKVMVGEVVIGKYLEMLGLPYCLVEDDALLEIVFTRELKNMLLLSKYAQ